MFSVLKKKMSKGHTQMNYEKEKENRKENINCTNHMLQN